MRITLNGYVVGDDDLWLYDMFGINAFSPETVRRALQDTPGDEALEIELNSGGGSVFAGFEIFSMLREAQRPVVAIVQSIAASAASTILSGCDEVLLSPVAQIMIHLPQGTDDGDAFDHRKTADILDALTESIINGYMDRCGDRVTRDELRAMMTDETWLTAQRAIEIGLADGLTEKGSSGAYVVNSAAYVNAIGGPGIVITPDMLKSRYDKLQAENKARNDEQQRRKARLAVEKSRYII